MDTSGISPLRQRMLDDLRMRKLNPKTQSAYTGAIFGCLSGPMIVQFWP